MMKELVLNKDNFEELVLRAEKPVLVDFWATWCGPCRMIAPVIEEIAEEQDDIIVGKVNVDENPELCQKYGIVSIPTLIAFKGGKIIGQKLGAIPKANILEMFE